MIGIKLLKCLNKKSNINMTFILPTDTSSTKILQGIIMLSKLKKFVLTDNMTYQQYMARDCVIKNYDTSTW